MPLLRRRAKADDVPRAGPFPPGWDVPARFNFTRDVVDALATDPLRQALTFVDREGIVDRRTFADLSGDAARWAHLLRTRLDRGDRVLIAVGKVPAWHGAMLGALKSGLVAVPCPDMLRARDLAFRVRDSGARLVVADRSLELEVEEMRQQVGATVSVVYLDEALDELRRYMPIAPTEDTTAGETAFILYTSGTTKDPKGVIHTHAYTWAQRAQATHWLDAHEGDVVWCTAGTGWAKAIWNVLLGPWSHGAEVVLHEGAFDPEERLSLLQRLGVTVLCQAPTEYRMLAKLETLGAAHLPRLRHAVSAGEPLNPEVIARFQDALGLTVHDGYGQTENSLLVANMPGAPIRPGSMGLPTPGHDVAVIDDTGHVCAAGVEGDLALIGRPPTLFTGYWGAPDETEGAFRDGWYVTGDRAVRDEDGYLWFVGRADDVIVSAAYRIGPFEVESALLEHPAVAESAVVGVPDLDRGEIVKAFVVLRPGHEPSEKLMGELQDHVKSVTAPYKYPRAVAFVEELPKTVSGKIRRSELRARGDELAIATVPTLSIVPEPVETDEAAELAEAEAARRSAEEAAERARAEAEAAERARIEAEAAARAKAEAEAAERARAEAEAAERARLEAEAAERARIEAEAAERVRIEAEEAARHEAEEAARIEAEAAERARLETEAAERAGIEAEAAEQARLEAEAAERARIEAEAAEQARLEAEAAERARLEAEEAARLEAEEAARLEAEAADRARAEAAAAELAEPELLEDLEDEEALGTAAVAVDERGESRAEARRRRREEKAAAKRRAEDERRQAKAEAEQRKRDEAAAHEAAKLRAEEEKQAAKQRAEDERRRAADEKEAAKRRAEEERHQAKLDAEQRKRQEAAAREAAHSREAAEQAAAKQQAEEERRRQAEEREAAKLQQEEERRRQREEAKARRGGGLGRLFKREEHDEFDDEEDDTPVEPIPDIVERLRFYSRESQAAVTEGSGSGEQPEEPVGDDQPPASRTADSE
ncbi:MAG TPA: AMP-binding protein [Gaiella sp.]|nr:AMP-binding protein [Gaiella sp.]